MAQSFCRGFLGLTCCAVVLALFAGCGDKTETKASPGEVVIYSSIDEPYLTPLIKKFETQTGITVTVVTDTEANKSSGIATRLETEKDNPRADVYWGNEIFHTVNLAEKGMFAPYRPKAAEGVPAKFRDAKDCYTDIGMRARVLVLSNRPEAREAVARVKGLEDLTNPLLKDKIAFSHPAFGTAGGHMAALYTLWGEEKYVAWLTALKANHLKLLGGNSAVADQTAAGTIWAGPTDNDDAFNGTRAGEPMTSLLPDQGPDQIGTLLLPTSIALVNRAPHPANAQKLIDFLSDPAVEKELIDSHFLSYSVRDAAAVKALDVDYLAVAKNMKRAVELAMTILQERE